MEYLHSQPLRAHLPQRRHSAGPHQHRQRRRQLLPGNQLQSLLPDAPLQLYGHCRTLLFSETAPSKGVPDSDKSGAAKVNFTAWWMSGDPYDVQGATTRPPNPKYQVLGVGFGAPAVIGSRHPGGVNGGFADGSVRFIKDSIDSWQIDAVGNSPSVKFDPNDTYPTLIPGQKLGVWQAIATRGRGEIISSDSY
jgi:prepilin-type processing-associated H-X9-DG protein